MAVNLFDDDSIDFREQFFIRMEPVTHRDGKRYYELAVRSHGEHVIYKMGGSFYLAFGTTGRTETFFLQLKATNCSF